MIYFVVAAIALVALGLFWTWWSNRGDRDPISSVTDFNRALSAMQPVGGVGKSVPQAGDDDGANVVDESKVVTGPAVKVSANPDAS